MQDPKNTPIRLEPEPETSTGVLDPAGESKPPVPSPVQSVSQRRALLESMAARKASGTKWGRGTGKKVPLPVEAKPVVKSRDIVLAKTDGKPPPSPHGGELEFSPTVTDISDPKSSSHPRASLNFEEQAGIDAAVLQSKVEAGLVSRELDRESGVRDRLAERDIWVRSQAHIPANSPLVVHAPQPPTQTPDQSAQLIAQLVAKITDMHTDLSSAIRGVDEKVDKNASVILAHGHELTELDHALKTSNEHLKDRISSMGGVKKHPKPEPEKREKVEFTPVAPPSASNKVTDSDSRIPIVEDSESVKKQTDINRRQSLFFGTSAESIEKSFDKLPKQFTDGSGIKARYHHYQNESIEEFLKTVKKQLQTYPKPFWIQFVMRQLSDTLRESVDQYADTLVEGRVVLKVGDTDVPCPAGFYEWGEFESYLLRQYHRPLREIRTLQKVLYELKQTASIEKYIMDLNHLVSTTSITLPDKLFKAIVLKNMRPDICAVMMKKKDLLMMSRNDFIMKATTIDDVEFGMKKGKQGGNQFQKKQSVAARAIQSKKDKARAAKVKAEKAHAEASSSEVCQVTGGQSQRKTFVNPYTQEGDKYYKDFSWTFCNFCKHKHHITECPSLWSKHMTRKDGTMRPMTDKVKKHLSEYDDHELKRIRVSDRFPPFLVHLGLNIQQFGI